MSMGCALRPFAAPQEELRDPGAPQARGELAAPDAPGALLRVAGLPRTAIRGCEFKTQNPKPSVSSPSLWGKTQKFFSRPSLTLALTGGFGSGKSEALRAFERLGAACFSADQIAHQLSESGSPLAQRVVRALGPQALQTSGALNREALAFLVFRDAKARRRLEQVLHPAIIRELRARLRREKNPLRVVEIPLLFEAGLERCFDVSLVVWASASIIHRRLARRGFSQADIRRRNSAQWPLREKRCKADIILDNTASRLTLLKQVKLVYRACHMILQCQEKSTIQSSKHQ